MTATAEAAAAPVSVIVPTWERRTLVVRALASVASQTRRPAQVVVVDDGSTDGTAEAVAEAAPWAAVVRQPNRGVAAARNAGLRLAEQPWIAFLDSDDEWLPEKLERQLEALAAGDGERLCHCDEIWYRRGRRVNPGLRHAKAGGRIFERCLELCAISPSAAVLHRSLLDEVGGFDESLPACEDYDLWLRICCREPVLLVDEPLVVKHGGRDDQLSSRVEALDRYRIQALVGLLESGTLDGRQRTATVRALEAKLEVYAAGAGKRGRWDEVEELRRIGRRWGAVVRA